MPYSYLIESNGTHAFLMNGTTHQMELSSTNSLTVLQTAVNNSPDDNSVIFVKSPFKFSSGELIINKTYVTIKTDVFFRHSGFWTDIGVQMKNVKIDSTIQEIKGVQLQGVEFGTLTLYAGGSNPVTNVKVDDCGFHTGTGEHGVVVDGDGTDYVAFVTFDDCLFMAHTPDAGYGMINFRNTVGGTGQFYFNQPSFGTWGINTTFIRVEDGGHVDFMDIDHLSYMVQHDGNKFLHINSNGTGSTSFNVDLHANPIEIHDNMTFITIDDPTSGTLSCKINIHDSRVIPQTDVNFTLMDNQCEESNWLDGTNNRNHCLMFTDNIIHYGPSAIFTEGVLGQNSRFVCLFSNNRGFVTENTGTTTNSTATTFVFNHGLASTASGFWASFNTTAINGWAWTSTTTQITVTVTGTSLPEIMACYWMAEYKP